MNLQKVWIPDFCALVKYNWLQLCIKISKLSQG